MYNFLKELDGEQFTPAYESVVLDQDIDENITAYTDTTEEDVQEMFDAQITVEKAGITSDLIGLQLAQSYLLAPSSVNKDKVVATYEASVKGAWNAVKKFFQKIWAFVKKIFHKIKLRIESVFMDAEKFYDKYKSEINAKLDKMGGKMKVAGFKDYSNLDKELKTMDGFYNTELGEIDNLKKEIVNNKGNKDALKATIEKIDKYVGSKSEYKVDTMIKQGPTTSSTEVTKETLMAEFQFASKNGKKAALDSITNREKSVTDTLKKAQDEAKKMESEASDEDKKNSDYMSAVKALTRMISKFITKVSVQLNMIAKMCNDRASQAYSLMRRLANAGYADKVKVGESFDFDAIMRSL